MPVYELPRMPVSTGTGAGITLGLDPTSSAFGPGLSTSLDLAQTLASIPGLDFACRGANAIEPNIRGFALDRIGTRFNGLPLFNSTPTRTGAPINFFGPGALEDVNLEGGLLSFSKGPVTIGPRLLLESFGASHSAGNQLGFRTFSNRKQGADRGTGRRTGRSPRIPFRRTSHRTGGTIPPATAAKSAPPTKPGVRGSPCERNGTSATRSNSPCTPFVKSSPATAPFPSTPRTRRSGRPRSTIA